LDIAMPNRDGIAILRILRANPRTEALPVIIFSALVGATVRAEALEAGADLFLEKPCTPEELERGIRHVLDGRPARTSHAT
jgi:CheY-like chemotaxis protein